MAAILKSKIAKIIPIGKINYQDGRHRHDNLLFASSPELKDQLI